MSYQDTTIVSSYGIKNIIGTIQYRNKHFIRVNNGPNILFLEPTQVPLCLREMKLIREQQLLALSKYSKVLEKRKSMMNLHRSHNFRIIHYNIRYYQL